MADDAATRARRRRRHLAGDHSLCRASSPCRAQLEPPGTQIVQVHLGGAGGGEQAGRGLVVDGPRAVALREVLGPHVRPEQVPLLDQACRALDRLDVLAAQLADAPADLQLHSAIGAAERTLIALLGRLPSTAAPAAAAGGAGEHEQRGDVLDELRAWRDRRAYGAAPVDPTTP